MADGRGYVIHRRDDVLTSEEAQKGAVEEGMRPVPPRTCSTMPLKHHCHIEDRC
jgi:hypothetical protein